MHTGPRFFARTVARAALAPIRLGRIRGALGLSTLAEISMKGIGIDVGKHTLDVAVHDQPAVRRFANTAPGIRNLLKTLAALDGELRVVVEATGGYEDAVLDACVSQGLWVSRVNPRQARHFAHA